MAKIKIKEIKPDLKVKEIKKEDSESELEREVDSSFTESFQRSDPNVLVTSLEMSEGETLVSPQNQSRKDDSPQFSESARYNVNNQGESMPRSRTSYNVALQSDTPQERFEKPIPNLSQRPDTSIRQQGEIMPTSRRIDDFSISSGPNFSNNLEDERRYEDRVDISFQNSKKRNIWEA